MTTLKMTTLKKWLIEKYTQDELKQIAQNGAEGGFDGSIMLKQPSYTISLLNGEVLNTNLSVQEFSSCITDDAIKKHLVWCALSVLASEIIEEGAQSC